MTNQNNIQDELRNLNSGLPVQNSAGPYSVSQGYFDGLAASVLAKIKGQSSTVAEELETLSPFLASFPKATPYSLPENYFDQNLSELSFLLSEAESPVVAAIGKAMPFSVPEGYFEALPNQVLAKVAEPKGKVVSLFARKWMRVAIAAVVGGIVFVSGYQYLQRSGNELAVAPQSLSASKVLQDIRKVSTEELENFIKAFSPAAEPQKVSHSARTGDVKALLQGVSKKEIESFLEQLPTADDDLTLMN